MTEDEKQTLPENPNIDRAALILFDGKRRQRFELSHDSWQYGEAQPPAGSPRLDGIVGDVAEAIWQPRNRKSGVAAPIARADARARQIDVLTRDDGTSIDTTRAANEGWQPPQAETVELTAKGRLLNDKAVELIEGEVYDLEHNHTYKPGDQMATQVWLRCVGPLPQRTADDAPVGYTAIESNPPHRDDITARMGDSDPVAPHVAKLIEDVKAAGFDVRRPADDGIQFHGNDMAYVSFISRSDVHALHDAGFRIIGPRKLAGVPSPMDYPDPAALGDSAPVGTFERMCFNAYDAEGAAVGSMILYPNGYTHDNLPGFTAPADFRAAVDAVLHRLHGVTTRSPSEAHALAGAQHLDDALSGSTEGIVGSVLADAEAHAESEKPLFTLSNGSTTASIYAHGIEMSGTYGADTLLAQAVHLMPTMLLREQTREHAERAKVQYAAHVLREAVAHGDSDDCDAAGELIGELYDWLNDHAEPSKVKPWSEMSEAERAWAKKLAADVTAPGFFAAKPGNDLAEPLVEAFKADMADIAREVRDEDLTARTAARTHPLEGEQWTQTIADGDKAHTHTIYCQQDGASLSLGGAFDAGDCRGVHPSIEGAEAIRAAVLDATANMSIDLGAPEGDQAVFTVVGKNANAMDDAARLAAEKGRALVLLTYAHAEGFKVQMVDEVHPAESEYIQARTIAKRHGAAILEHRGNGNFRALNPDGYKLKGLTTIDGGKHFIARPRKPKT